MHFGLTAAAEEVRCVAQTLDGHRIDITATGFGARVLQHEIDHLNGVLFIDKLVSPCEQQRIGVNDTAVLPPLPAR
jgi:peptide deformylase